MPTARLGREASTGTAARAAIDVACSPCDVDDQAERGASVTTAAAWQGGRMALRRAALRRWRRRRREEGEREPCS